MEILLVGLSHRTVGGPRARSRRGRRVTPRAWLAGARAAPAMAELVVLATCHRVELYAAAPDLALAAATAALGRRARSRRVPATRSYRRNGVDAVVAPVPGGVRARLPDRRRSGNRRPGPARGGRGAVGRNDGAVSRGGHRRRAGGQRPGAIGNAHRARRDVGGVGSSRPGDGRVRVARRSHRARHRRRADGAAGAVARRPRAARTARRGQPLREACAGKPPPTAAPKRPRWPVSAGPAARRGRRQSSPCRRRGASSTASRGRDGGSPRADRPVLLIDLSVPRAVDPGGGDDCPALDVRTVDDLGDIARVSAAQRAQDVPLVEAIAAGRGAPRLSPRRGPP